MLFRKRIKQNIHKTSKYNAILVLDNGSVHMVVKLNLRF